MYQKIDLKSYPDLKAVIQAAFPDYRKKQVYVSPFQEPGISVNSYWESGSRSEFAVVHLPTLQRKQLPTKTHPFFDVASAGVRSVENQDLAVDHRGNATLKRLPPDFVLVAAGTDSGKPATAHVYVNLDNMPMLLAA